MIAMVPDIDLDFALYRGAYSVCLAEIEDRGIPIDKENLDKIRKAWPDLLEKLTVEVTGNMAASKVLFSSRVYLQNIWSVTKSIGPGL